MLWSSWGLSLFSVLCPIVRKLFLRGRSCSVLPENLKLNPKNTIMGGGPYFMFVRCPIDPTYARYFESQHLDGGGIHPSNCSILF